MTAEQIYARILEQPPGPERAALERWFSDSRAAMPPKPVTLDAHLRQVDPGPHRDLWQVGRMVEVCQAALDGEITRLAFHAPPRTYKSRTVNQGLSSGWIRNNPAESVYLGMAGEAVLLEQSKYARDMVLKAGVKLRADSKSKSHWRTEQNGGLIARTPGSDILGVGGHLIVIDDPFGSEAKAARPLLQRQIWSWATRDIWQRAEARPDGRPPCLVLMLQRLADQDLAGRLYAALDRGEHPFGEDRWTVCELKGRARPRRVFLPAACSVIEDPRPAGAPLCEGTPLADGIQAKIDERAISDPDLHETIDQQEPREGLGGGFFKRSFFRSYGDGFPWPAPSQDLRRPEIRRAEAMAAEGIIPPIVRWVRGVDLAAGGADALASVLWAIFARGQALDMAAVQITEEHPPVASVAGVVEARAKADGPQVEQALPSEVATGKGFAVSIKTAIEAGGSTCHLVSEAGAKGPKTRAYASAAAPSCRACGAVIVSESEAQAMEPGAFCACENPQGRDGRIGLLLNADDAARFRDVHHEFTGEEGGDDHLVDAARIGHAVTAAPVRPSGGNYVSY